MIQLAGFWMALATFLSIWLGHVGVRWLEARSPRIWPPIVVLVTLGLLLNIFSVFVPSLNLASNPNTLLTISGLASIVGITLLWDALEMYRQQGRVKKGHAPANPNNPRHAAYLAAGTAMTEDLLAREPQGAPAFGPQNGKHAEPLPSERAAAPRRQPEDEYEYAEVQA